MTTIDSHAQHPRQPRRLAGSLIAGAVTVAALTAALTSGGSRAGQPIGRTASSAASAGSGIPSLSLTDRVFSPSAFPGFIRLQQPVVVRTAAAWATGAEQSTRAARETERLQRLGFVAGVDEHLHGRYPVAAEVVSVVEQYRSAAGARAELAYQYKQSTNTTPGSRVRLTRFAVGGIPSAVGFEVDDAHTTGINVMFTNGRFFYVLGSGFPHRAYGAPTQQMMIAGAGSMYTLVNGCFALGAGQYPAK
jgi:hypothetical protein